MNDKNVDEKKIFSHSHNIIDLFDMPFDQYQRYRLVSDIINKFRNTDEPFRILEIGAGFEENLKKFLPNDVIYYMDKRYPSEYSQKRGYIIGDILKADLTEKYDFVVAIDVYEHITQIDRKKFVDTIIAPSKIATVIAAPFDQENLKTCEFFANEVFKISHGSDYIWLKEHIENGLPSLSLTIDLIKRHKIHPIIIPNGYLPHWFEMISTFLLTEGKLEFSQMVKTLNEFYNQNYYQYGNRDPAYRKVIIIPKDSYHPDFSDLFSKTVDLDNLVHNNLLLESLIEKINRSYQINEKFQEKDKPLQEGIKKIQSLEQATKEKDEQLAELSLNIQELTARLSDRDQKLSLIEQSVVWQFTMKFNNKIIERILPQNTRRRKYYDLGIKGGRLLVNEGVKYTFSEFKNYWKTKKFESIQKKAFRKKQKEKDDFSRIIKDIPPFNPVNSYSGYVPLSEKRITLSEDDIKCIAFYLPQFHPIPENDRWWGNGFTEWTNVTKAQPQFKDHYQPRLPDELGYYDLRVPEIQKRQIELARQYGIYGFCFHYYWFNGKRLLERPLNQFIENKEQHFPFCICWANENWTRRWDGMENEILIAQNHSPESDIAFIEELIPLLKDSRYIRIDGKPLIIVYRASLLPEPVTTTNRWREYCRTMGIGEIYLVTTHYFGCDDPRKFGFDAAVEFPPHTMTGCKNITNKQDIINPKFTGTIYDYAGFVKSKKFLQEVPFKLFKTVSPGWDNTARRQNNASVFHGANPQLFKEWLYYIAAWTKNTHRPEEQIVFINAWNEWAEGAYLEPDKKFGYGYLQATADIIKEIRDISGSLKKKIILVSHDAHLHGAQMLALHIARVLKEQFHYEVHLLLKSGGRLEDDFRKYAIVYSLERDYPDPRSLDNLLTSLCSEGIAIAICNTVVTGDIVELLARKHIRTISLVHELPGVIRQFGQEENVKKIARFAERIIFPADIVRDKFSDITVIDESKCVICPQGLFLKNKYKDNRADAKKQLREILSLPIDCKIILNVGYADSRKGIDLFVDVARKVLNEHEDVWFVWVGLQDESFMRSILKVMRQEGIIDRILFPGIRRDDLDLFYSGSDIFLLTSREDPFPSVVLDAMNTRLPVIGFNNAGGFRDIITEDTGILVPYLSVDAMADAVSWLLKDPRLCARLGANAAEMIESQFCFTDYIYDLLGFLGHEYKKTSVILPSYNYAHYLPGRLASILSQTYPLYEIIAIDDKSRDMSADILRQAAEQSPVPFRVFINPENSGSVFRQWARGIGLSRGDYIWIAEADDMSDPRFLEKTMEGFSDDSVVLSYSQSRQIDENGVSLADNYFEYTNDIDTEKWKKDYTREGMNEICDSLAIKNTIPNVSAVVFKKRDISIIVEDLARFRIAGDWYYYIWLLKSGSIAYHSESLNLHRRHQKSVTTSENAQRHFQEIVEIQDYVMNTFPVESGIREKVLKYRGYVHTYLFP